MRTIAEILKKLGGTVEASKRLEVPASTVSAWKSRGNIPAPYWLKIVTASGGEVSYEDLGQAVGASEPSRRRADRSQESAA